VHLDVRLSQLSTQVPLVQREEGTSSLATDDSEDKDLMAIRSLQAGMRKPKQEQPTQTNEEVRLRHRTVSLVLAHDQSLTSLTSLTVNR
jgi:hypothetical protein